MWLYRVEVKMPDDVWLSFMLSFPHDKDTVKRAVALAYPEAREIKLYQIDPV